MTKPPMSGATSTASIHSACEIELHSGVRYVVYGQGDRLMRRTVDGSGTITQLATLSNSEPFDAVFANNQLFISNGVDNLVTDAVTVRPSGIRPASAVIFGPPDFSTGSEAGGATLIESTATIGSWTPTVLSGYAFHMAWYNTITGHVGIRAPLSLKGGEHPTADRLQIVGTQSSVVIHFDTLPTDALGYSPEWVRLLGRTPDGGEVPYALIDLAGNFVTAGQTATVATLTLALVDYNSELPLRSGLPPATKQLAWALGRMYAIKLSDPHQIAYSEAESDATNGDFVGRPEQSWPANNLVNFPTGDAAVGIHEVDGEIWVWSRNHLMVLSELGGYNVDGISTPYPRVVWPGCGIAGQRAFVKTRYGPIWLTAEKELMTVNPYFRQPEPISAEYEAALLAQIGDQFLSSVELAYHRDVKKQIDRVYVRAKDADGNPLVIVHDFRLRTGQNFYAVAEGQGFEYEYSGAVLSTFVANRQFVIGMRDQNGAARLWAGLTDGTFAQLEDSDSDAGAIYSGEFIGVLNLGRDMPSLGGVSLVGDSQTKLQVYDGLDLSLADLQDESIVEVLENSLLSQRLSLYRAGIDLPVHWAVIRISLDAHPADGTLDVGTHPGIPINTYGRLMLLLPEIGRGRPEGVSPA